MVLASDLLEETRGTWLTSKWIRMVQAERGFNVEWRFISLRLINSHVDYDAHFPPVVRSGAHGRPVGS